MDSLKIRIGIIFVGLLIAIITFFWIQDNRKGVDQLYLLPNNFEGCVTIYYNVKNAPPLKISENTITYYVPEDGIIQTSSPLEFGWVNQNNSGSYRLQAFYMDKNGDRVRKLTDEEMSFGATGSIQNEEKTQQFYYQFYGPEGIEDRGCPAVEF